MGWTDERIDVLRKLWQDGLSANQIARQLGGVTRNAVIGKVHRLGLSGRATPSQPTRTARVSRPTSGGRRQGRRTSPAPARPPRAPSPPAAQVVMVEGPGLATPLTLGRHMCKWPIGDPKGEGFSFCGRLADGPYCPAHAQVAYQPSSGKSGKAELERIIRRYAS